MATPDPRFSFAFLLHEVAWMMRRDFQASAENVAMTQVQARALAHVSRNEGIKQSALAQRLEIQPMTLARLIDRMQKAGLVERRRDAKDRRAFGIYLSRAAGPALKRLRAFGADLRARSLRGFTAKEERTLVALLDRMKQNMGADMVMKRPRRMS